MIKFFAPYRESFADWKVEHDIALARTAGLVKQCIAMEALRDGAYRLSCSIALRTKPSSQLLFRFLDAKHREVLPRDHHAKWLSVIKAMESQFVPPVRAPLSVSEVIRLAEEEETADNAGNIQRCVGLAVLIAGIGQVERALRWCDIIEKRLAALGRAPADWELSQASVVRRLRDAIGTGQVNSFLKEITTE